MGPRAGLDRCGKSRPPPGFDPRTVQPVSMRVVTENSIFHVQSDSGGQVIILGGDNIDRCPRESCLNLAFECVRFLFVGWDGERGLQNKCRYT